MLRSPRKRCNARAGSGGNRARIVFSQHGSDISGDTVGKGRGKGKGADNDSALMMTVVSCFVAQDTGGRPSKMSDSRYDNGHEA